MSKEITLPYIDVGDIGWSMMRLEDQTYTEKRNALVDKVYEHNDVDPELCPEAWAGAPLTRWCWLVLHVNDLEYDPEVQHPLTHWGIDIGFAGEGVRQFVWAVA